MARETATERRAREAIEAREAMERWQSTKHEQVLKLLARIELLKEDGGNAKGRVIYKNDVMYLDIEIGEYTHFYLPWEEICQWNISGLNDELNNEWSVLNQRKKEEILRREALKKLTEEEKEVLGLKGLT